MAARPTTMTPSSIGLAALNGDGVSLRPPGRQPGGLRLLSDRRDELGALRTQAACRFHRLLAELTPGGTHRDLKPPEPAIAGKSGPGGPGRAVRLQLAVRAPQRHPALDAKLKSSRASDPRARSQTGTHSSPTSMASGRSSPAASFSPRSETVTRFPSKDHFASYNGTAPIDALSPADQAPTPPYPAAGNRTTEPRPAHDGRDTDPHRSTCRNYYERKPGRRARHRKRQCAASSADAPMSSIDSSSPSGQGRITSADHLRPRSHPAYI